MAQISFTVEKDTPAAIERVFAALTDHRAYASMTPVRTSTLDREGTPAPNGVGAVRRLTIVGPPLVEEITAYEAPHRFAYRLISGLPVRDHVGEVTLREQGGGTHITWKLTSTPTIPGGQYALGPIFKQAFGVVLRGAIKTAEARG